MKDNEKVTTANAGGRTPLHQLVKRRPSRNVRRVAWGDGGGNGVPRVQVAAFQSCV